MIVLRFSDNQSYGRKPFSLNPKIEKMGEGCSSWLAKPGVLCGSHEEASVVLCYCSEIVMHLTTVSNVGSADKSDVFLGRKSVDKCKRNSSTIRRHLYCVAVVDH